MTKKKKAAASAAAPAAAAVERHHDASAAAAPATDGAMRAADRMTFSRPKPPPGVEVTAAPNAARGTFSRPQAPGAGGPSPASSLPSAASSALCAPPIPESPAVYGAARGAPLAATGGSSGNVPASVSAAAASSSSTTQRRRKAHTVVSASGGGGGGGSTVSPFATAIPPSAAASSLSVPPVPESPAVYGAARGAPLAATGGSGGVTAAAAAAAVTTAQRRRKAHSMVAPAAPAATSAASPTHGPGTPVVRPATPRAIHSPPSAPTGNPASPSPAAFSLPPNAGGSKRVRKGSTRKKAATAEKAAAAAAAAAAASATAEEEEGSTTLLRKTTMPRFGVNFGPKPSIEDDAAATAAEPEKPAPRSLFDSLRADDTPSAAAAVAGGTVSAPPAVGPTGAGVSSPRGSEQAHHPPITLSHTPSPDTNSSRPSRVPTLSLSASGGAAAAPHARPLASPRPPPPPTVAASSEAAAAATTVASYHPPTAHHPPTVATSGAPRAHAEPQKERPHKKTAAATTASTPPTTAMTTPVTTASMPPSTSAHVALATQASGLSSGAGSSSAGALFTPSASHLGTSGRDLDEDDPTQSVGGMWASQLRKSSFKEQHGGTWEPQKKKGRRDWQENWDAEDDSEEDGESKHMAKMKKALRAKYSHVKGKLNLHRAIHMLLESPVSAEKVKETVARLMPEVPLRVLKAVSSPLGEEKCAVTIARDFPEHSRREDEMMMRLIDHTDPLRTELQVVAVQWGEAGAPIGEIRNHHDEQPQEQPKATRPARPRFDHVKAKVCTHRIDMTLFCPKLESEVRRVLVAAMGNEVLEGLSVVCRRGAVSIQFNTNSEQRNALMEELVRRCLDHRDEPIWKGLGVLASTLNISIEGNEGEVLVVPDSLTRERALEKKPVDKYAHIKSKVAEYIRGRICAVQLKHPIGEEQIAGIVSRRLRVRRDHLNVTVNGTKATIELDPAMANHAEKEDEMFRRFADPADELTLELGVLPPPEWETTDALVSPRSGLGSRRSSGNLSASSGLPPMKRQSSQPGMWRAGSVGSNSDVPAGSLGGSRRRMYDHVRPKVCSTRPYAELTLKEALPVEVVRAAVCEQLGVSPEEVTTVCDGAKVSVMLTGDAAETKTDALIKQCDGGGGGGSGAKEAALAKRLGVVSVEGKRDGKMATDTPRERRAEHGSANSTPRDRAPTPPSRSGSFGRERYAHVRAKVVSLRKRGIDLAFKAPQTVEQVRRALADYAPNAPEAGFDIVVAPDGLRATVGVAGAADADDEAVAAEASEKLEGLLKVLQDRNHALPAQLGATAAAWNTDTARPPSSASPETSGGERQQSERRGGGGGGSRSTSLRSEKEKYAHVKSKVREQMRRRHVKMTLSEQRMEDSVAGTVAELLAVPRGDVSVVCEGSKAAVAIGGEHGDAKMDELFRRSGDLTDAVSRQLGVVSSSECKAGDSLETPTSAFPVRKAAVKRVAKPVQSAAAKAAALMRQHAHVHLVLSEGAPAEGAAAMKAAVAEQLGVAKEDVVVVCEAGKASVLVTGAGGEAKTEEFARRCADKEDPLCARLGVVTAEMGRGGARKGSSFNSNKYAHVKSKVMEQLRSRRRVDMTLQEPKVAGLVRAAVADSLGVDKDDLVVRCEGQKAFVCIRRADRDEKEEELMRRCHDPTDALRTKLGVIAAEWGVDVDDLLTVVPELGGGGGTSGGTLGATASLRDTPSALSLSDSTLSHPSSSGHGASGRHGSATTGGPASPQHQQHASRSSLFGKDRYAHVKSKVSQYTRRRVDVTLKGPKPEAALQALIAEHLGIPEAEVNVSCENKTAAISFDTENAEALEEELLRRCRQNGDPLRAKLGALWADMKIDVGGVVVAAGAEELAARKEKEKAKERRRERAAAAARAEKYAHIKPRVSTGRRKINLKLKNPKTAEEVIDILSEHMSVGLVVKCEGNTSSVSITALFHEEKEEELMQHCLDPSSPLRGELGVVSAEWGVATPAMTPQDAPSAHPRVVELELASPREASVIRAALATRLGLPESSLAVEVNGCRARVELTGLLPHALQAEDELVRRLTDSADPVWGELGVSAAECGPVEERVDVFAIPPSVDNQRLIDVTLRPEHAGMNTGEIKELITSVVNSDARDGIDVDVLAHNQAAGTATVSLTYSEEALLAEETGVAAQRRAAPSSAASATSVFDIADSLTDRIIHSLGWDKSPFSKVFPQKMARGESGISTTLTETSCDASDALGLRKVESALSIVSSEDYETEDSESDDHAGLNETTKSRQRRRRRADHSNLRYLAKFCPFCTLTGSKGPCTHSVPMSLLS